MAVTIVDQKFTRAESRSLGVPGAGSPDSRGRSEEDDGRRIRGRGLCAVSARRASSVRGSARARSLAPGGSSRAFLAASDMKLTPDLDDASRERNSCGQPWPDAWGM